LNASARQLARDPGAALTVGTLVVYGSYGIGTISDRLQRGSGSNRREIVVIEFPKSLLVTLPLDRAVECLRPLAGKAQVALVQSTLRSRESIDDESWQRRTKLARSKIVTGDAVALAEVIRDAARRDGRPTSAGGVVRLSAFERELYLEARQLLAAELSIARATDHATADAWIDDQLGFENGAALALTT
jgi:CarD family transcriptional regulator